MTAQPASRPTSKDYAAWDQAAILDLAADLVRIPTRGGRDSYTAAARRVMEEIAGVGLDPVLLGTWTEPLGVTATLDFGPGPHYVLDACLDTADTGDLNGWNGDPFSGEVHDGWLHGRGSSDSKTAVAIFAALAGRIAHEDLRGKLTILFDLDEHTGGFGGIKAWLGRQGVKPDGVMIGYPGNDKVVVGGRGVWRARVTVHGRSAHSGSSTNRGLNAITEAAGLAARLEWGIPRKRDDDTGLAPQLTVTGIRGGGAWSVVPDRAEVDVDVRLTAGFTAEAAEREVRVEASSLAGNVDIEPMGDAWPAYHLSADHELVRALRHGAHIAGLDPTPTVAGPSNIGCYLSQHGIPATAGFGVAYRGLHAANEAIDVASIPAVYVSYYEAVRRLLGA